MEILFPREPYLFLGKALSMPGEPLILPCLPVESCPWVPWGKRGASQVQRYCSTFLGALRLRVMWQRYKRRAMENPLGTEGLQCVASAETCSFPGSEHR